MKVEDEKYDYYSGRGSGRLGKSMGSKKQKQCISFGRGVIETKNARKFCAQ